MTRQAFTEEEKQLMNGSSGKSPIPPRLNRPTYPQTRNSGSSQSQNKRLADIDTHNRDAITALAKSGVNGINAQVFAFDTQLTTYERGTAKSMAQRLRQSPLRIRQYLLEELGTEPEPEVDYVDLVPDDVLEIPDLTGNFLAIAPASVAGALPM